MLGEFIGHNIVNCDLCSNLLSLVIRLELTAMLMMMLKVVYENFAAQIK